MARKATVPQLSESQKNILLGIIQRRDSSQHLVQRVQVVLLAAEGQTNKSIAPQIGFIQDISVVERNANGGGLCLFCVAIIGDGPGGELDFRFGLFEPHCSESLVRLVAE